jgi:hypothetical protein
MSSFSEPVFPVSYSTISEQALLERLLPEYAIPRDYLKDAASSEELPHSKS